MNQNAKMPLFRLPESVKNIINPGIRPTFVNRIGGCYEIAFDLVIDIENGRSFAPPDSNNAHKLSTIIDHSIVRHYTKHKPYCYMFLAYSPELS